MRGPKRLVDARPEQGDLYSGFEVYASLGPLLRSRTLSIVVAVENICERFVLVVVYP